MNQSGDMIIMQDTFISGKISNCNVLEIHGYIDGTVQAKRIIVREAGRLYGTIDAEEAEIHGEMQGDIKISNLIKIGHVGSVSGSVQYGQLAVEVGGILSADVHNVPPRIAGDLDVTVNRGQSVRITLVDLTSIDPDDIAKNLKFTVSNANAGFVAKVGEETVPLNSFTQSDLQLGTIMFVHDGSAGTNASFDVVVADGAAANSGKPNTINVNVK